MKITMETFLISSHPIPSHLPFPFPFSFGGQTALHLLSMYVSIAPITYLHMYTPSIISHKTRVLILHKKKKS